MGTTYYMLYDLQAIGLGVVYLGGGSSTPPSVRIYETRKRAEQMRDLHFLGCRIKEISL